MDRRGKRTALSLVVALLLLPALLLARSGALRGGKRGGNRTSHERVEFVIDGDTLKLEGGERVRMLGIDAPEMREGKPGRSGPFPEAGAVAATARLRALIEGRTVKVVRKGHDHYDRTLAKIYLPDGTDVGRLLIREGLARKYSR